MDNLVVQSSIEQADDYISDFSFGSSETLSSLSSHSSDEYELADIHNSEAPVEVRDGIAQNRKHDDTVCVSTSENQIPVLDTSASSEGKHTAVDSSMDIARDSKDSLYTKSIHSKAKKNKKGKLCNSPAKSSLINELTTKSGATKDIITTGAFLTRATMRQLGLVKSTTDLVDSPPSIQIGSKAKVLNLDKKWYTAIILAFKCRKCLIHYPKWEHSYNEWISLDSRRLRIDPKTRTPSDIPAGSSKSSSKLDDDDRDSGISDIDIAELLKTIPSLTSDSEVEEVPRIPQEEQDKADTPSKSRPRGRPSGKRNRRRVGHVKSTYRRKLDSVKPLASSKRDSKQTPHAGRPNIVEGSSSNHFTAVPNKPFVPPELMVPTARILRQNENPYAKVHHYSINSFESNAEEGQIHWSESENSEGSKQPKKRSRDQKIAPERVGEDPDWGTSQGEYVTTGAFLTRRAVKCLTTNQATGGILQVHHGYHPGQLVEVLSYDRKWYQGRVISYHNKKFLVNFTNWSHEFNEWIPTDSKRMRKVTDDPSMAETEDEARKKCASLVSEYNRFIEEAESRKAIQSKKRKKTQQPRKVPVNARIESIKSNALAGPSSSTNMNIDPVSETGNSNNCDDADIMDLDSEIDPISVETGYRDVPQMPRIKDYAEVYRTGMNVAARDRNKDWWKAKIIAVKSFRILIHYIGFPSVWDEWMEMNTQRIMIADECFQSDKNDEVVCNLSPSRDLSTHEKTLTIRYDLRNDEERTSRYSGYCDEDAITSDVLRGGSDTVLEESNSNNADEMDISPLTTEKEKLVKPIPDKRLGRPPLPDTKSAPLSLRLALKAAMEDQEANALCYPEEAGAFPLPKSQMTTKDYAVFMQIGDKIRVRDRDKQWYDATIINFKHGRIRVGFDGHSADFNQWVEVNSERIQVLRKTIEGDRRLEKLERNSRIALRRKRDKVRMLRRQRSQAAIVSFCRFAENLEYIVDKELSTSNNLSGRAVEQNTTSIAEARSDGLTMRDTSSTNIESTDPDDIPLLALVLKDDAEYSDSVPLFVRLMLRDYVREQQISGANSAAAYNESSQDNSAIWFVYCNQCKVVIRTFRYYCKECEKPSEGYDYESFDLCLMCFSQAFPTEHPHPRSSFAREPISSVEAVVSYTSDLLERFHSREGNLATDGSEIGFNVDLFSNLASAYEPDTFDSSFDPQLLKNNELWRKLAIGLHGTTTATNAQTRSSVLGHISRFSSRTYLVAVPDINETTENQQNPKDAAIKPRSLYNQRRRRERNPDMKAIAESIPRCAFCGEDDSCEDTLGGFAADRPFILTTQKDDGSIKRHRFWAHYACAKYSPEVLVTSDGKWYNVAVALKRARTIKCASCKQRGASIGCFYDKCSRSYHVSCTQKQCSYFESGRLFWCKRHANGSACTYNKKGKTNMETPGTNEDRIAARGGASTLDLTGQNGSSSSDTIIPDCANCGRKLANDLMWMMCLECPSEPEQQFCMCLGCYEAKDSLINHPHKKRCFREHVSPYQISYDRTNSGKLSTSMSACEAINIDGSGDNSGRPNHLTHNSQCHYCRRTQSRRWRHGYGGVLMCEPCFKAAHTLRSVVERRGRDMLSDDADIIADNEDNADEQTEIGALNPLGTDISKRGSLTQHGALVEDYNNSIYFTREMCVASHRTGPPAISQQPLGLLNSYGPTDSMLFTLIVDTTYFDIPGRAPRWGSHSGTDYHGTWLPQTVRRALLRYTKRGEHVLSNFLGRGTDAIECFLLSRKCIGVDINPSAVALSQRNCSFAIPSNSDMDVEYRPVIMQGDARDLCIKDWHGEAYFAEPESYDHILSHPPYKDCVLYSASIEGDLSRFPGPEEFQTEMEKVIKDSWTLLKMGRHVTVGIGDNRAECFYIPVSYQLVRNYIRNGFELEELIVKRQRYCQAFGLGTYLCVQFDFLMFTHEFIATLRKVPKESVDLMHLNPEEYKEDRRLGFHRDEREHECQTSADCIERDISDSGDPTAIDLDDGDVAASAPGTRSSRVLDVVSVEARILRSVPPCPIERNSVVMGSVWTFEPHRVYPFPQLCMSRMVERFGRDNSNWEEIRLRIVAPPPTETQASSHSQEPVEMADTANKDEDSDSSDDDSLTDSSEGDHLQQNNENVNRLTIDYEKERQAQIQKNREQLLQLGLVSELGEESTDTAHYKKMLTQVARRPISTTPLSMIIVPHIPSVQLGTLEQISAYRRALVQITHDASARLSPSGLLVLGVQDAREIQGRRKLWPLGMLVLEDVQRAIGDIKLRLKEFIVVVEKGHSRKRDDILCRRNYIEEKCVVGHEAYDHLPIVHAYYFVLMKLK